ncbi:predicted protein [Chaetoceros tenuissimus]|uniref:Uncharacterized protein n=1 Tax=Chaetoceros tenuissimus TaxID=426638 RepID=A0AAD3D731_9STRA|nr:predicted protein [Chaetoceros tenuissimus]
MKPSPKAVLPRRNRNNPPKMADKPNTRSRGRNKRTADSETTETPQTPLQKIARTSNGGPSSEEEEAELNYLMEKIGEIVSAQKMGLNDDAKALVKDAVVKSIPTLADQLVPVLVPKLCDALVPVLAPKLAEAVLPMLETARSTSTSDPAKTKAEHEELHWPQMTNSKKGSFIIGCPFNGGFEKCELLRTGLENKKMKREELRVHGENCNDCGCH